MASAGFDVQAYLQQLAALARNRAALWGHTTGNWEVWYDGVDTADRAVPEAFVWDTPYDDDWRDLRVRGSSFAPNTPERGILLVDRVSDSRDWNKGGYLQRRDEYATKDHGLTLEFRAYIYPDAGAGSSNPGLSFSAYYVMEDGTISGLFLSPGRIAVGSYNHIKVSAEFPTTNGFHTYRLVQLPGSNHFLVYVDGNPNPILQSDGDATSRFGSVTNQDNPIISIGGEGAFRTHYQLDYVRYRRGAFDPDDAMPLPLTRSAPPLPPPLPPTVVEDWTGSFSGHQTPPALGWTTTVPSAWTALGNGSVEFNSVQFADGIGPWASLSQLGGLPNKGAVTIELRAKVLPDSGNHGFTLHHRDEMGSIYLTLSPDKIETAMPKGGAARQTYFMDTTDDYHLFRLVRDSHSLYWNVYVDGNPVPVIYDQHVGADTFTFTFLQIGSIQQADYAGYGTLHGHVVIDFIRWTPVAYAPQVPPPLSHPVTSFDLSWRAVASGDFNGDGNTDILWQNPAGLVAEWFMANGTRQGTMTIQNMAGWNAIASGDFNGDGTSDILWQNSSGLVSAWFMENGTRQSTASLQNMTGWTVLAAGDFNRDGITDIIWSNGAGSLGEWLMGTNGRIAGTMQLPFFPGWTKIATGDYNHDGNTDILWQNASGLVAEWLMGDGTRQGTVTLQNMSGWNAIASADFNGDGTSDVMWRNAEGLTAVWFMQNGQISHTKTYGWSAAENVVAAGDFNQDGVADVMWQNTVTGQITTWQFDHNGLLI